MNLDAKPELVLIPGWGADARVWVHVETMLSSHFQLRHLPLMSEKAFSGACLDRLVTELAEAIPEGSVLCAWSLGAMLAVKVAARFPHKVSRLVLLACNAAFVQTQQWSNAMARSTFSQFVEAFDTRPEKTQKRFAALQAKGSAEHKALLKTLTAISALESSNHQHAQHLLNLLGELDISQELAALSIPTMLVFGENDALVPVSAAAEIGELMAVAIASGLCQIQCIDECGHVPQLSHADTLLQRLGTFLSLKDTRFGKDKRKIAQSFSRASRHYDQHAGLQRDVAAKLVGKIGPVGGRVADLGCGTAYCIELLAAENELLQELIGVDIAFNMLTTARKKCAERLPYLPPQVLHFCLADIEQLPFDNGALDWAVSSLAIQWCDDVSTVFSEVARVLKPAGYFAFSSLGPLTLHELNSAWAQADASHVHVNQFFSKEALIEAAEGAGFELIHASVEFETLHYDTVFGLMRDLKGIGAHNVNNGSNKGLTGKATLKALTAAYDCFRDECGKLPATYEVQYWLCRHKQTHR